MLFIERKSINGNDFIHTYSDKYTIQRDGLEYIEAYDPMDSNREYTETNILKSEEVEADDAVNL